MWECYLEAARRYPKLSLARERRMIAAAQAGRKSARDELVLRHIGFLMWRLRTRVFRQYLERYGDDLLSAAILTLYQKIRTYDLRYRDRRGVLKPVRFVSYVWKRIDGLAIDHLKRESRSGVSFDEARHVSSQSNIPIEIHRKALPARCL
jgi:DNA-directed RNA polymerase specialized sigma subunit